MTQGTQAKKEARIIDGKKISEEILLSVRRKIIESGATPGLAVILIGDNPSSKLYVKNKERRSREVGIEFHRYLCNSEMMKNAPESEILTMIDFLNNDPSVSGILVQLPLPPGYDTDKIIARIDPKKDADGFHPENIKKVLSGKSDFIPPLIKSILKILDYEKIDIARKTVTVISKSTKFSLMIVKILENKGAHARTVSLSDKNAKERIKEADILISISGKPRSITGDMVKEGAVVIDVGITKTPEGFQGDVDFESVKKVASYITPTPGGVGPITVAMLLDTIFEMAQNETKSNE